MAGWVVQAFATVAFARVTAGGRGVWIALSSDDLAGGAALLQTAAGQLQVEVALHRTLSERGQLRVMEDFPPAFVEGFADGLAGGRLGGFGPVGDLCGFGFLEVRAYGAGGETHCEQGTEG